MASGLGGSVDSGPATPPRNSDPVKVSLLVLFLFVLPSLLLFVALRFPRLRHSFLSPLHKGRHNRTPVMERADRRNGEQVRPLRFHLNAPPDIPLTPLHKELLGRPAPPNKPLPPDPGTPAQIPLKPLVPVKPRLVAPLPNCPPRHGAAANPAGPKRRPPLRPAGAQRVDSSAL
ncbi:disintegrin and metalloproteinase domain-containing protein 15-like isoform X2 [Trematomus bernacchii]|uniref:disintegrin and metalloproteinase domain-containing protein 15-like isoform X2 n=1 Tax=Trematomus bernacchii TaxID=40690 RepID=UPI00146F8949|nr:disintegrin and metalloproteinase domain-containing protein 15-like isoform X2 [Trematomus bernacchii]